MKQLIKVIKNIIKVKIFRKTVVYYTYSAEVLDNGNVGYVRHKHILRPK